MFEQLSAEFPRDAISWRAQSVTKDGTKAMALAYIDARDVMDRLDEVCGPAEWQDRYEFHGARTICYLSIRVNGEWITKADGAGDSDVEAEKGAISDALKRAAVKWGIGRYLYHLKSPWVPCECSDYNGKKQWKSWTASPWDYVRGQSPQPKPPQTKQNVAPPMFAALEISMRENKTVRDLAAWWKDTDCVTKRKTMPEDWQRTLHDNFTKFGFELKGKEDKPDQTVADIQDTFPGSTVVDDRMHPLNAG